MKIFKLTGVVVIKTTDGLIVQVNGLSATAGWSNLSLQLDDPNPNDRVLEYVLEGNPPDGISIQVLTPVSASAVTKAANVDAILVKSRTNAIEVHASDFQSVDKPVTTLALGEEGPLPTTLRLGEEDPMPTTYRIGEEGFPTTLLLGEENPTTERLGEEEFSTHRFGEEGPLGTDIRVDDPVVITNGGGLTTLAVGEEGPSIPDPRTGRTPFGGF